MVNAVAETKSTSTSTVKQRYAELTIYAVLFLGLVLTIFSLNLFLSQQSQQDASMLYLATRQQRSWESVRQGVEKGAIAIYSGGDAITALALIPNQVDRFDAITKALSVGGIVELEDGPVTVTPINDVELNQTLLRINKIWDQGKSSIIPLSKTLSNGIIDTVKLGESADFMSTAGQPVIESSQNYIVQLGKQAEERTKNLQVIQIGALIGSILIFILMAIRLIISLRKQDRVIQERSERILEQNNLITQEKEKVESLLKQVQAAQSQLVQSEKMSALGQMVAGVAHELNTPIGYAKNNISLIQERFTEVAGLLELSLKAQEEVFNDNLESALEKYDTIGTRPNGTVPELQETMVRTSRLFSGINSGFEQMTNLVRSMRNFSRLDEADKKLADINEGLLSSLIMIGHQFKDKTIELITHYGELPKIDCYPAQLNQVFLNLINNAIHAMEDKPDAKLVISTKVEGNSILVSVQDNGSGIPKSAQSKIFDPFFTTKPVGQGTGLGLSISYDIIKKHGGELSFVTEDNKGTTFNVRLPITDFLNIAVETSKKTVVY